MTGIRAMAAGPVLPARRGWLLAAAGGAASMLLAGCGFKLRQAPVFAFKSIAIPANTAFANFLRRSLKGSGTVEVLPTAEVANAEVVFEILAETRDNVIASTDINGQVNELLLRLTIRFRLHGKDGREWLASTSIQQTRDLTYNETAALAKQSETELLFTDMQNDIAQQVVRRLAAVKRP